MERYDLVIAGGGMVGAAVALGAARKGKSVALIEGVKPQDFDSAQPMDIRVSAISKSSVGLLSSLGAWDSIAEKRVCPYRRLETWEHPECRTRFDADSLDMDLLGYIVENRLIQLGIWEQLKQYENVELICPDSLESIRFLPDCNAVILKSGREISASLVVGADGANSRVRQIAGIGITAWDYRQECMLINVETEKPQQDITWQWFTQSGPRSFLPLPGHQGSLVWYDSPKKIRQLAAMQPEKLAQEVMSAFPKELGDVKVLQAGSFPLTRRHARKYHNQRCVLVGDSAHTINPLAGQGVNLGFKDVAALLEMLDREEWDSDDALNSYEKKRLMDNTLMQSGMDFFYKTFKSDLLPVKFLRNAGLKMADNAGPLKQAVLRYALGL